MWQNVWKQKSNAWQSVTYIGKKQLLQPPYHFQKEMRYIFEQVNIEKLVKSDGLKVLLQHKDKQYNKSARYEEGATERHILDIVNASTYFSKYWVNVSADVVKLFNFLSFQQEIND